jgi:ferritin-like metal-binding protein YciE
MPGSSKEVIRRYLQEIVAAEMSFESQFRAFSEEGDDEEVRAAFAQHADETRRQHERLNARLKEFGGASSSSHSVLVDILSWTPKLGRSAHRQEEKTAHNLIVGFAIETGECAIYEALASIAKSAGDTVTESLARQIQAQERQTAEKLWRFIPSRAKIAFNMLTAGEVDPSVETRAMVDRIV